MNHFHLAEPLSATETGARAPLGGGFKLVVDLLEDWLIRVAITPDEGLTVDRTWMITPQGDAPWSGRDRLDLSGFTLPSSTVDGDRGVIAGKRLAVEVGASPLCLRFLRREGDGWRPILSDRPTGAYAWHERRGTLRHFQARLPSDRHYGLGDKAGPLDRTGRRFRCLQVDALGYDAERSDPLYKHAPFLIVEGNEAGAVGLLYDTLSETAFDLGAEHSNYHPPYRHVDAAEKGLVYYLIDGPRLGEVVPRLTGLTGRPHFPPRWSLGFAFTSMHHADAPDAQAVIAAFARRCRKDDVPISAIHSGSGYTTGRDGRRYVFTWNAAKFPDRGGLFRELAELGFRTAANVKPVLLTAHPSYEAASAGGWFVRRRDGSPAVEMFWGGEGASLDFTNPETVAWWQEGVRTQVLGAGFDAVWNDNNEGELWDETAMINGFGRSLPAIDMRPVHALLMTRASFEATRERHPDRRPYTISRAGPIGISRYAETWSGDNRTSWHTLKWNLRNGLSMSLSGMPFVGHDIGGFDGPKPEPELFVRWAQMMALHPRAVMNSWKPELAEPTNLPWMHPDATGHVREALRLRYRFLPLLYHLAWHCHIEGEPIIAPLFYHFDDPACRGDADAFMLGTDVLVAPVIAPGAASVAVRLPRVEGGWQDFASGAHFEGGSDIELEAPLDRLPILVRTGAVLPLAAAWPDRAPHDASEVELVLFAGDEEGASDATLFFDDGESWRYRDEDASLLSCRAAWTGDEVRLFLEERWTGRGRPPLRAACRNLGDRNFEISGMDPDALSRR